jgi:hypothetical protein
MNKSLSLAILLVVSVGIAFSSGYWIGNLNPLESLEANSTTADIENRLAALENQINEDILTIQNRLAALESRINEQLFIVPVSNISVENIQFTVINIGTANVSLSDIKINGVTNSSGLAWTIEDDNTLMAGEISQVAIDLRKYSLGETTGNLLFSFITTKGNIYYCILPSIE